MDAYLWEIAKGYNVKWTPPNQRNDDGGDDGEGGVKASARELLPCTEVLAGWTLIPNSCLLFTGARKGRRPRVAAAERGRDIRRGEESRDAHAKAAGTAPDRRRGAETCE